tara:strand:+ start:2502 stop:3182 length:681 start_codon:yes stop_codon:yes gene_type:complete
MRTINPNGLVLWESDVLVVILTNLRRPSRNLKTGDLLQIFIFYKHELPSRAIVSGNDRHCCGDCKRRPLLAKEYSVAPCYVLLWQGPDSVWKCWNDGGYGIWDGGLHIFRDKLVRFGAYGDPAFIPKNITSSIIGACKAHTGYTHQWADPMYITYRDSFKASVDTFQEHHQAKTLGWSTYRARGEGEKLQSNEHVCPASKEAGQRKQCETCMLCNGHGWDMSIVEH